MYNHFKADLRFTELYRFDRKPITRATPKATDALYESRLTSGVNLSLNMNKVTVYIEH